jgi:mycoredoxin
MPEEIRFYETEWCWDCRMAKNVLDRAGVAYQRINIEQDPEAARFVMDTNRGNRSVPTIVFPDGSILVEPGRDELLEKLQVLGLTQ